MDAYLYPIRGAPSLVLRRRPSEWTPMTWLRVLVLMALGAAAAVSLDRLVLRPTVSEGGSPPVSQSEPGPGDPPLVWLDGTLETISDSELAVREGQGPRIVVERFAAGATAFLRRDGDEWRELSTEELVALEPGEPACVEALLDGETFLALRVFLAADCGPAVTAGG